MSEKRSASTTTNTFRVQTVSNIGNDRVSVTLGDYDPTTGTAPMGGASTLTLNLAANEAETGGFYPGNSFTVTVARA